MKKTIKYFFRDNGSIENQFTLPLTLDIARADKENQSIPCVISTETAVDTYAGPEVLIHTAEAVNMERAGKGLPLLSEHYGGKLMGRVREIALSGKKMIGRIFFSKSAEGQAAYQDAIDDILTDISVGGSRDKVDVVDGIRRVLNWTPIHVALAPGGGADINAGINRDAETDRKEKELIEQGRQTELTRQVDIKDLFKRHLTLEGVQALQDKTIADGETIERAREILLDELGKAHEPVKKSPAMMVIMGMDEKEKFSLGINRALSIRCGCATEEDLKDQAQNQFLSYTPVEIARHYLTMNGVNCGGMTRQMVMGDALTRAAIMGTATSSDFPNILADVANKSLLLGYNETDETWQKWCQVGNIADFKQANRVNLSEFDNLDEVPEGGEYNHGKFTDLAEFIKLLTYGKLFTITRQALINDDLSALSRIPRGMGRAASRKVGDLAYSVLTSNPIMNQDGTTLFHVDHNNIGTPGIPSVETLDEGRVAMALQMGPQEAATLGIRPSYGICSTNVETIFRTLIKAQYDPATDAGTLTPNAAQGMVEVVAEHRLSRDDPGAWYLAAAGSEADTVEVAFLDGNSNPYLEQQEGFTRDGVSHKVRIDAAAAPMDFRGLFYNAGDETLAMAAKVTMEKAVARQKKLSKKRVEVKK